MGLGDHFADGVPPAAHAVHGRLLADQAAAGRQAEAGAADLDGLRGVNVEVEQAAGRLALLDGDA
jgi:hypothetical protein